MTNYTVNTLELGEFITESGETIDHLRLRYEHVGLPGQPCRCLPCTYWQSFNIQYRCATWLVARNH